MKKILLAMTVMFLLLVWPFGGLWGIIFTPIMGGGVEQSFIYPLYGGLIIISGIITGSAVVLHNEIKALREELKNAKDEKTMPSDKEQTER